MTTTQQFIPIEEIKDDLIFLKDGSVSIVITTSAVNFELLFETEQISIIQSFAGFINSLSFPIQIVIRSRRLDVSSYLTNLDRAALGQRNPLLKNMIGSYRRFAESIIKENNVLDKQFYVCINVTSTELWTLSKNIKNKSKRALTILSPRRDHVLKQLARLGLKARQLDTPELIKLFYDVYNAESAESVLQNQNSVTANQAMPSRPVVLPNTPLKPTAILNPTPVMPAAQAQAFALRRLPQIPVKQAPVAYYPSKPQGDQSVQVKAAAPSLNNPYRPPVTPRTAPPFIVEELPDEYGP